MKKLLLFAFAAFALAACSDDDNTVEPRYDVISFETSEGMLAIDGKAVQLGDITVSGGSAAGNHHNVFWAKGGSYDDLAVGGVYNGYLCSTSDEKIWFGTYFSADIGYGDYWGGFVLSANYGRTLRASIMRTSLWYGPIRGQTVRRTA